LKNANSRSLVNIKREECVATSREELLQLLQKRDVLSDICPNNTLVYGVASPRRLVMERNARLQRSVLTRDLLSLE
jgi:hypothetical protein